MSDQEIFKLCVQYHNYLLSLNSANPVHPLYSRVIVGRVMQTECEYLHVEQMYRVIRLFRRYLRIRKISG